MGHLKIQIKLYTPAHAETDQNEKVRDVGQAASVLVQDVCAKVYCAERCRGWDSIAVKMESHAVAVHCRRLQCMAEHFCALQCVAVDGTVLQSLLSSWTRLQQQSTAEFCSVLHSVRVVPSDSMAVTAVSCRPQPSGTQCCRVDRMSKHFAIL